MSFIYKVLTCDQFCQFEKNRYYAGNEHDLRDGFIHMVSFKLLAKVIEKHYAGNKQVVILKFDEDDLGTDIKWEKTRDGELYPHLYSAQLDFSLIKFIEHKKVI